MNHRLSSFWISVLLVISSTLAQAAAPEREWNFLIFMNGVNSLDTFTTSNLKQMEAVGSNDKINILVQWGTASNSTVKRLRVEKSNDPVNVTSPILQDLGVADMGDYNEVVKFVDWANTNFPAKKYFIAIWDHGGGWHLPNVIHPQDISWDDRTGHFITTEQLGQALASAAKIIGHKVDVYGSDACMMGMIEVASEVADSVNYYVGSQEVEPGQGWPYTPFLTKWLNQIDTLTPANVATLLSSEYKASYSGGVYGHQSVTMSSYDLSHLSDYEAAVKAVGDSLVRLPAAEIAKVATAGSNSKFFTELDYHDVLDFVAQLNSGGIKNAALSDMATAQKSFVMSNDENVDNASWGVSIWIPTDSFDFDNYSDRYKNLKFNQHTGWYNLVKALPKTN